MNENSRIWNERKKIYIGTSVLFLAFASPYAVMFLWFFFFGSPPGCTDHGKAAYSAISHPFTNAIAFVITVFSAFLMVTKHITTTENRILKETIERQDRTLKQSKIVFEAGISEFKDDDLLIFHRILAELKKIGKNISIFAIDNTDPRTWWTDNMIGYLALLSQHHPESAIHRIFVCQMNDLKSPVFAKLIGLHSLMGFRTYVIEYNKYKDVVKKFKRKHAPNYDMQREVFIWREETNGSKGVSVSNVFGIDCCVDNLKWSNVKCFQSYWKSDCNYNSQKEFFAKEKIKSFYKSDIYTSDIKTTFEFIDYDKSVDTLPEKIIAWDELPQKYLVLIGQLIKKMKYCKDASGVIVNDYYCGIEIENCSLPGICFTTMSNVKSILQKYYDKLLDKD